jgi:hypothetical protein
MTNEIKTIYQRMIDAREHDSKTNGKVIKPFKSSSGSKSLFYQNELVTVAEMTITDRILYVVSGLEYKKNKNSFLGVARTPRPLGTGCVADELDTN